MANLFCIDLVEEPIAAAVCGGFETQEELNSPVAVYWMTYDLGGGTLDTAILKIKQNCLSIKAVAGNNECGGEDIDNLLVKDIKK